MSSSAHLSKTEMHPSVQNAWVWSEVAVRAHRSCLNPSHVTEREKSILTAGCGGPLVWEPWSGSPGLHPVCGDSLKGSSLAQSNNLGNWHIPCWIYEFTAQSAPVHSMTEGGGRISVGGCYWVTVRVRHPRVLVSMPQLLTLPEQTVSSMQPRVRVSKYLGC